MICQVVNNALTYKFYFTSGWIGNYYRLQTISADSFGKRLLSSSNRMGPGVWGSKHSLLASNLTQSYSRNPYTDTTQRHKQKLKYTNNCRGTWDTSGVVKLVYKPNLPTTIQKMDMQFNTTFVYLEKSWGRRIFHCQCVASCKFYIRRGHTFWSKRSTFWKWYSGPWTPSALFSFRAVSFGCLFAQLKYILYILLVHVQM